MQVLKILYNIDYRGLNKINQEIEYIKDNKVLNRKKSYETFKLLLSKNKKIKNKKEKLTYKEIEDISGISKRTYYYINKEVKQKGLTYWKTLEIDNKNSTKNRRPKNFRKSKILNNKEIIDKILKIRLDNPTYGKSKIKAILDREYKNINNIDNNNSNNIDNNNNSNNIDNNNNSNNIDNNIYNNISNNISESTIGRILKELSNKSLITLKGSKLNKKPKPNEINNTKPRNFNNSYSKRWNYKNNSITIKEKDNKNNNISNKNNIGTMIQIDHLKYHNSKINLRFVEFSAIDPTTRIKQSYCYATPSSKNAKDFLINHLIPALPFNIKSIQVDGGSEFRKYFEEACKELNIPLYVLPPYSPKYNGRIEAQSRKMMCLHNHFNLLVCEVRMERSDRQISNRTIREEFYNNKKLLENCITRADYNDKLKEYIDKYNNYRPHQALDFKTPMEYYLELISEEKKVQDVFGL